MISPIETRNWTLLTVLGSIGVIYSLWLPWISRPFGAKLRQGGFLKLESPELRNFLTPLSTAETGIGGVVDLGLPTPTWVFVAAIAIAGVILILRLTKFFETSWWVATHWRQLMSCIQVVVRDFRSLRGSIRMCRRSVSKSDQPFRSLKPMRCSLIKSKTFSILTCSPRRIVGFN